MIVIVHDEEKQLAASEVPADYAIAARDCTSKAAYTPGRFAFGRLPGLG